ncbi:MAG: PAS domain S-box protein [Microthrixaceae bacterium]|nr:PAS domain S-box protein [Microthrixaceae bacterium]
MTSNEHTGAGASERPEPNSPTLTDLPELALRLMDAMPDPVIVVDEGGRIALANAEAEAMFHYEPGSMLGLSVEELVPHGLREHHRVLRGDFQEEPRRRPMGKDGQRLAAVTSYGAIIPTEISLSPYEHAGASYVVASVRNVSDRVQLDLAHHRVLESLDALPSLVVVVDPNNLWIGYANDGARNLSGYPVDELTSMTPLTLLPSVGRDDLTALVESARNHREASMETELLRADGQRLPVEIRAAFVGGGDSGRYAGDTIGEASPVCVLFGRDLSERNRAEERHRAALDKLRRVAVAADISIWALDPDGAVTFAQGAEWTHVGLLGDAGGLEVGDVFGAFPTVVAAYEAARAGDETSAVVSVGDETRQFTFQPVTDRGGEVIEVIGTAVDVGELEAARQVVALERDRLSSILRSMSEGVLMVTSDGEVLEANPALCGLVGRSRAEVLGSRRPHAFPGAREGTPEIDEIWEAIADVGHAEYRTELTRPDGSEVPVLLTADRVSGRPDQALLLFSDLSARQRFEADLDSANAVLVAADERERIARDLHDRVIQRIFATGITLQSTQNRTNDPRVAARLGQAVDELDLVIRELRTSVFELHQSPTGDTSGVRRDVLAVIDEATRVLGFRPDLRFDGVIEDLDVDLETDLLAVLREALTNVARHAAATSASVAITVDGESLELVVDDNGRGVDRSVSTSGHGIRNMGGRAERRGGSCELASDGPGTGSTLCWRVPLAGGAPRRAGTQAGGGGA